MIVVAGLWLLISTEALSRIDSIAAPARRVRALAHINTYRRSTARHRGRLTARLIVPAQVDFALPLGGDSDRLAQRCSIG
jgi:hypothetical protein